MHALLVLFFNWVDATILECFGKPVSELFEEFDYEPLASASIAQVHRARLRGEAGRGSGARVAVKVQHRGIEGIFLKDMERSIKIARVCAYLNPDFNSLVSVLRYGPDP